MGLYEYFDALRREHPHLIIDSSASGGRRIDFEMLSGRSRSGGATSPGSPSSRQIMTATFSYWRLLPFSPAYSRQDEVWVAWQFDRPDQRHGRRLRSHQRAGFAELQVAGRRAPGSGTLFLGDYTRSPGTAARTRSGWPFDRSRRSGGSPAQNLNPAVSYSVTDLDAPDRAVKMIGAELMGEGLSASVRLLESALFVYERVR